MYSQKEVVDLRIAGHLDLWARLSVMAQCITSQLRQVVVPGNFCVSYAIPAPLSWSDPSVWLIWLSLLLASAGCLTLYRFQELRGLGIGVVFFWAGLAPTLNIVPAPDFRADRYLHLALLGLSLICMTIVFAGRFFRIVLIPTVILWIMFLVLPSTWSQTCVWRNSEALWTATIALRPDFAFAYHLRAMDRLERGELAGAEADLRQSLALDSSNRDSHLNLALLLKKTDRTEAAVSALEALLAKWPTDSRGQMLLDRWSSSTSY